MREKMQDAKNQESGQVRFGIVETQNLAAFSEGGSRWLSEFLAAQRKGICTDASGKLI